METYIYQTHSFRHYCKFATHHKALRSLQASQLLFTDTGINLQLPHQAKALSLPSAPSKPSTSPFLLSSFIQLPLSHSPSTPEISSSLLLLSSFDMSRDDCFTTQLIDKNGEFKATALEDFVRKIKLAECGLSYAVVSIMGPQSSGMFVEVALVRIILYFLILLVSLQLYILYLDRRCIFIRSYLSRCILLLQ